MILDVALDWFFRHFNPISLVCATILFVAHWVRAKWIVPRSGVHLSKEPFDLITTGGLGAGIPTGLAIAMGGYDTSLVPRIGEFSVQLGLVGLGMVYFSIDRMTRTLNPPAVAGGLPAPRVPTGGR